MRLGVQEIEAAVTVNEALSRLPFPISKREAIRIVGPCPLPLPAEEKVELADLLAGLPGERLTDRGSVAKQVDQRWDRLARTLADIEAHQAAARRP